MTFWLPVIYCNSYVYTKNCFDNRDLNTLGCTVELQWKQRKTMKISKSKTSSVGKKFPGKAVINKN